MDHSPFVHRRIGKFQENDGTKNRPVRVTFSSETIRDDTLKAYHRKRKELKLYANGNKEKEVPKKSKICMRVSVRKDLTPMERKEEEDLFQELTKKRDQARDSGDDKAIWIRRNSKVINVGKYPTAVRSPASSKTR